MCGRGERSADLVSNHGVEYRFESGVAQWEISEINVTEDDFISCVTATTDYSSEQVNQAMSIASVYVFPDKFPCLSSPSGYCNGAENFEKLSVRNFGSPKSSDVAHEVAHWLELLTRNITDYDHKLEPNLWKCT